MTIREELELREKEILAPWAAFSAQSRGRSVPEEQCDIRPVFQRDRDRILHSKSFRRLKDKTQVFLSPDGDHYRTRMTHTLEVSQNARTIAKALRLNEDLVEAIALGHDLGHTPFGHSGEDAMQELYSKDFTHYKQSLRVVEKLERDGQGLNLTWEVRDGIVNHTGKNLASTLEGVIVKYADRIAYINHDIDDAMRGGIIYPMDIPLDISQILGFTHGGRIDTLVADVVTASQGKDEICQSPECGSAMTRLRAFMFERVYYNPVAKGEESKAKDMLSRLYEHYYNHPETLPEDFQPQMSFDGLERTVCDYIAGMTDNYAVDKYTEIFIPMGWQVRG